LNMERCVGTIQSGVLGPYRAVCWDHTERCVGTIQSGVLGPYRAVCWDPYIEGQIKVLNRVQKRAAKFAKSIN
jgi:hypothetical protein